MVGGKKGIQVKINFSLEYSSWARILWFLGLGRLVWVYLFFYQSEISSIKFRHPTKGIPVKINCSLEYSSWARILWFLNPGRPVWVDLFFNQSEICSINFLHHKKGIPVSRNSILGYSSWARILWFLGLGRYNWNVKLAYKAWWNDYYNINMYILFKLDILGATFEKSTRVGEWPVPHPCVLSIVAPRYYKYPLSDSLPLPKCTARELFFPNLKEKQHGNIL